MDSPAQSKTPTNCPSSPSNREELSNTDHIAHHEDITPKAEDTVQPIAPRSLLNLFESPHCLPAMDDRTNGAYTPKAPKRAADEAAAEAPTPKRADVDGGGPAPVSINRPCVLFVPPPRIVLYI
jgi:hypothetical protein